MRLLSDAREGAWGVVQGVVSELDFDFDAYAARHFERLERAVADGDSRDGSMPRPRELPDRARVVIIGGGVGGAAIAYHSRSWASATSSCSTATS